ncbi:MAG: PD-(D/E)XK nuclease family protein, partial [Lachnospiraceae bacterium]|nr:PD-(D/E)XK nuclease family protein [Lachnospiraceae bacterium]
TASLKSADKVFNEWLDYRNANSESVPYNLMMSKNKFSQWLGHSIVNNKAFDNIIKKTGGADVVFTSQYNDEADITTDYIKEEDIIENDIKSGLVDYFDKLQLINWDANIVYDEELKEKIQSKLHWTYDYENTFNIPAKASVTELKTMFGHGEDEEEDKEILLNNSGKNKYKEKVELTFNKEKGQADILKGANLGTVYHRIFELFDFNMEPTEDNVEEMLSRFVFEGKITQRMKDSVKIDRFISFAKSNLYKRMKAAYDRNELYRERSFLMGVKASDIIPGCDSEEMIVVQGIIDVCFIEDGRYIIADYKTDNVNSISELSDKYSLQLQCYAKALNMIDKKGVSELIIYSVKFDKEEPVALSEELRRGE